MSDKSRTLTASDRELAILENVSRPVPANDIHRLAEEIKHVSSIVSCLGVEAKAFEKKAYKDDKQERYCVLAALVCSQIYINRYLRVVKKQLEDAERRVEQKKRPQTKIILLETARKNHKAGGHEHRLPPAISPP